MDDVLPVLSRWIHVGTAIVLLGGAAFQRFVLMPAARELPETDHDRLRAAVRSRWKIFVHAGIFVLLATGFFNYLFAWTPAKIWKLYHPLMGVKILLALAVFLIASALIGRSKAFEGMRAKSGTWMLVMVLLGAVIVGISGYLKVEGAKKLRESVGAAAVAR